MMSGIKNMISMFQGNPQAMIQNLAAQNPQMQNVFKMVNGSGKSPKDIFMSMAKEKGINPNDILGQLGL